MADDTIEVEVKPNIDEKGFAAALQNTEIRQFPDIKIIVEHRRVNKRRWCGV